MLVCSNTVIARPNPLTTFHSLLTLETAQLTRICTEMLGILLKSLITASKLLEHCLEWLKIAQKVLLLCMYCCFWCSKGEVLKQC